MMQNPQYTADFEALMTVCEARNVAVQTIKSLARRLWEDRPQTHTTWYQPLEAQDDIDRAVHWVLARPGLFLNMAGDVHLLPHVLDAASRFAPDEPAPEYWGHGGGAGHGAVVCLRMGCETRNVMRDA